MDSSMNPNNDGNNDGYQTTFSTLFGNRCTPHRPSAIRECVWIKAEQRKILRLIVEIAPTLQGTDDLPCLSPT